MLKNTAFMLITLMISLMPGISLAKDDVLHIYSSRHYSTDEAFYNDFTKETGIEIKRVEGKGDALIARIKQEGKLSPADILMTVDSGRLWRAEEAGLFQSVSSETLSEKIPPNLRHPDGKWFGFSTRARVLVYNQNAINAGDLTSYKDLTDPKYKGRVCVRSSNNIYNLSLLASMIAQDGEKTATQWASGVLENLARKPQGGDTDQIKAVARGICDVALVNSYYFFRLQRSQSQDDQDIVKDLKMTFPDQQTT